MSNKQDARVHPVGEAGERDKEIAEEIGYLFQDLLGFAARIDLENRIVETLATVRREARAEAFKDAVEIAESAWVLVPAESENRPLESERWAGYNLAAKEIKTKLEAAAEQKES